MRKPAYLILLTMVAYFLILTNEAAAAHAAAHIVERTHYSVTGWQRQTLQIDHQIAVDGEFFTIPVAIYGNHYHWFSLTSLPHFTGLFSQPDIRCPCAAGRNR